MPSSAASYYHICGAYYDVSPPDHRMRIPGWRFAAPGRDGPEEVTCRGCNEPLTVDDVLSTYTLLKTFAPVDGHQDGIERALRRWQKDGRSAQEIQELGQEAARASVVAAAEARNPRKAHGTAAQVITLPDRLPGGDARPWLFQCRSCNDAIMVHARGVISQRAARDLARKDHWTYSSKNGWCCPSCAKPTRSPKGDSQQALPILHLEEWMRPQFRPIRKRRLRIGGAE